MVLGATLDAGVGDYPASVSPDIFPLVGHSRDRWVDATDILFRFFLLDFDPAGRVPDCFPFLLHPHLLPRRVLIVYSLIVPLLPFGLDLAIIADGSILPLFPRCVLIVGLFWFVLVCGLHLVPGLVADQRGLVLLDDPPLLLNVLLVTSHRRLRFVFFPDAITRNQMHEILLIGDRSIALGARFSPRLALLNMHGIGLYWHVKIAVLTILRFLLAATLMFF
jgi:hypothetical protein